MKNQGFRILSWILVCVMLGLGMFAVPALLRPVSAGQQFATQPPTPSGPDRWTTRTKMVAMHEWWLIKWEDNIDYCHVFISHDGLPESDEIYRDCGEKLYNLWKNKTWPCNEVDTTLCKGYYWQYIGDKETPVEETIPLPKASVVISLEDCALDPNGWCTDQPRLVLKGKEPVDGHVITNIAGVIGNDGFMCDGDECHFRLSETNEDGIDVKFWALSSFGDTSPTYDAVIRVISSGTENRLTPKYYVDVLSTQWIGKPNATCSLAWRSFPPAEGLPKWLSTPDSVSELATEELYDYLAANLITNGGVNVQACEDGGLLPDGSVSLCGRTASEEAVKTWQNQFDNMIYEVALETEVPAQLLKNLFSRESQFWPGYSEGRDDIGLGQLTENGADTTLLWNPTFYKEFCPSVLSERVCRSYGYSKLSDKQRSALKGALLQNVDGTCYDCPMGINVEKANRSVAIFARTMLANCEQTGKIIQNVTGDTPGKIFSYENLWKLTLVNYNAGPGCLGEALDWANALGSEYTWDGVAQHLSDACRPVGQYISDISR